MRPRDFWPTIDARAIPPLVPHLQPGARYAEPMAGDASLINLLAAHAPGLELAWASDIHPSADPRVHENDALSVGLGDADMFISNPPWTRAILHQLILHLSDRGPTWFLFDSVWLNTGQAGAFMERCRKVVHVGRLIWVPGTKNAGFTSCSWYLFGKPIAGSAPIFYGHRCLPAGADRRQRRVCYDCGVMIDRFGKWRLQMRNGTLTPVHRDCLFPSHGAPPAPPSTPLFDWAPARKEAP